ncbi:hypothetical protein C8Q70DRAFT_580592 [Cubamyces menziesii]|nr:hypothetical protein C8Q70DRAFT_580592 [Cubamyces menziesii]
MGNRFSAGNEEASPEHVQLPQHRTLSTRLRDALNHDTITYQTMASRFLTMPQPSPSLPSRPDFPSFTVPNLCADAPYDGGDLDTYPERHGWVVHHQDKQCHILCPPGVCYDGIESDPRARYVHYKATGPISPMLSRVDGSPVTSATKIAFLQAWLFFGTLHELSNLCGLAVDVERDFLDDDGRSVSTAALHGLAGRCLASLNSNKVGNKDFMKQILTIARRMALLLSEEVISRPESQPVFHYTPDHARVFLSVDILLRVLGLHIILHINSPRFSGLKKKRRETERIRSLIHWVGFSSREGRQKLSDSLDIALGTRGWCKSELVPLVSGGMHRFTAVLDRPLARDHSTCELSLCHAYQIDEVSYQTAHTDACHSNSNSCDFVPVPTEDLVRKLALDEIPVVVLTEDLEMRVVGSDEYPYIAFSHGRTDEETRGKTRFPDASSAACLTTLPKCVMSMAAGSQRKAQSPSGWTPCAFLSIRTSRSTAIKPFASWGGPIARLLLSWSLIGSSRSSRLRHAHSSSWEYVLSAVVG